MPLSIFLPNTPPAREFPIVEAEQRHSAKEPICWRPGYARAALGLFSLTVRNSRNHLSDRDVGALWPGWKRGETLPQALIHHDLIICWMKKSGSWRSGVTARPGSTTSVPCRSCFDTTADKFPMRMAVKDEWGNALSVRQVRKNSSAVRRGWQSRASREQHCGGGGPAHGQPAQGRAGHPAAWRGVSAIDPTQGRSRPSGLLWWKMPGPTLSATPLIADFSHHRQAPMIPLPQPRRPEGRRLSDLYLRLYGQAKGVLAPHGGFANMIQERD